MEITAVEVLDRAGRQRTLAKITSYPFIVGRGYDCDLIIQDPFVCARHLQLTRNEQGEIEALDLSSANGTFQVMPHQQLHRAILAPDTELRIGHTLLRFRGPKSEVAPTTKQHDKSPQARSSIERPWFAVFTCLTVIGWGIALSYLGYYSNSDLRRWLTDAVSLLVISLLVILPWVGTWALVSRIIRHSSNFASHLSVCCLTLLAMYLVSTASDYGSFAFDGAPIISLIIAVLYFALCTAAIYYHLRYSTFASRLRVTLMSFGFSFFFVGVSLLYNFSRQFNFSEALDFPRDLKPPSFQIARNHSVEEFFAASEKLEQEVKTLLEERQ